MTDVTLTLDDDHVAVVEWHRPPANFFDRELLAAVADLGEQAQADGARAIVLASEGKHFCAGANLGGGSGDQTPRQAAEAVYAQARRIFALDVPLVAAVQGAAVGGGLGLACAADFRVAGPKARFEANFARLGFHAGFAVSLTLPRIVGAQHAGRMLYTGCRVGADEAVAIGLADRTAEQGQERTVAVDMARDIAKAAPLAVQSMRRTQRADLLAAVDATLQHELDEQEHLWQTEDAATGIRASFDRSEPVFHGR